MPVCHLEDMTGLTILMGGGRLCRKAYLVWCQQSATTQMADATLNSTVGSSGQD